MKFCSFFFSRKFSQEAQEGLYHHIGDEFRKHPERMVDSPFEGLGFVMNGSYVNMNVIIFILIFKL